MTELLKDLNPQQIEAVKYTEGPCLVVAGPGSGKTRVLTHRAAYLIESGRATPEEILLVTFTNKAANEMRERITQLLPQTGKPTRQPSWIGTFHALCARILRKDGGAVGLPPSFVIFDQSDSREAIKKVFRQMDLPPKKLNPLAILNAISGAKNELVTTAEYLKYAYGYFQEMVARVYPEYQKFLRQNNALDFDDLLMVTAHLFEKRPEVLKKYQQQFHYVLVDEYQDTNHAQYTFCKRLVEKHRNICAVGDMSQAIYSWRGADFRNILNFQRDYPEAKIFRLEQNYRSTQTIITAASHLIRHNRTHVPLVLWTKNEGGAPITLLEAGSGQKEAEFIVDQIWREGLGHPLDTAILYRTNAQSRAIEETLLKAGVPYILVGGTRFYERKEIKDILAYLRIAQNPRDEVSQDRVEKLGKTRRRSFEKLRSQLPPTRIAPLDLLDAILEATGYLDYLDNGTAEGLARVENVKELRSVAAQFESLTAFLENVALVEQEELPHHPIRNGAQKNAVHLMTLHAAKGLEFSKVFMVGMEEGLLPHARSSEGPSELEEERRLCYVGMTRAKEKLVLSYARRRLYFGSIQQNPISRFVTELPQNLLDFKQWKTF